MLLRLEPEGGYAGCHSGTLLPVDVGRRRGRVGTRRGRITEAVDGHTDVWHDARARDALRRGRVEAAHGSLARHDGRQWVDVYGVEARPREALSTQGTGNFGGPVIVRGVTGI